MNDRSQDSLQHYGVKGMKWGERIDYQSSVVKNSTRRDNQYLLRKAVQAIDPQSYRSLYGNATTKAASRGITSGIASSSLVTNGRAIVMSQKIQKGMRASLASVTEDRIIKMANSTRTKRTVGEVLTGQNKKRKKKKENKVLQFVLQVFKKLTSKKE